MGYVDSGKAYLIQLGPPILLEQTTVAGWCVLAIPVERDPYASKKGERARAEGRPTRARLTHGASADEKAALYAGTAARFYGMEHLLG